MARPQGGYTNSAGQPIPGTTDITGRFMDRSRLMYWAHKRGAQGLKLYDNSELNIGTAVHTMAELDMKGDPEQSIEFYLTATLRDPEQIEKARTAFAAFRQWRTEFAVEAYKQEISLVSEALQFGGTLDTVATIRNGLGLVDFKTSASGEVYVDHVLQLAAYGILWNETHPGEPLTSGYHLIVLPKDGSKPVHREWTHEQLKPYRRQFMCFRRAYDYDALCNDPAMLQGTAVKPSKPKATKPAPKAPATPASIGELMRAYGLIREEARA
jgi:hypothetical protein